MKGRVDADLLEIGALLLIVVAVLAAVVWGGFWVTAWVQERERCDGLNASLCSVVRWSDERECRAGEGCGLPLENEPR